MRLDPINQKRIKHKPLRSFKELAQECGKTVAELRGMLNSDDAPKHELKFHGITYYDHEKFVAWFNGKVAA